jgi:hypothetical protein
VNGVYPDAGTQGTNSYIQSLAPSFINKLPVGSVQSAAAGFFYEVASDKKTYCVYARNIIFKPESQTDLYSSACPKTWVACKGKNVTGLVTCSGITGS